MNLKRNICISVYHNCMNLFSVKNNLISSMEYLKSNPKNCVKYVASYLSLFYRIYFQYTILHNPSKTTICQIYIQYIYIYILHQSIEIFVPVLSIIRHKSHNHEGAVLFLTTFQCKIKNIHTSRQSTACPCI